MNANSTIKARLGIQSGGKVHAFFTETCYRYMSPFVPGGEKSHLNQVVDLEVDSITYQSPSAHYLWFGKVMGPNIPIKDEDGNLIFRSPKGKPKHYTGKDIEYHTPGTGAHWDKKMWSSKGKEVVKEVQIYLDRGCK